MKELSIEEKAQHYDEALERYKAKQEYESQKVHEFIEYLFPELKESEDEKIRKVLYKRIIRYDPNNEILIKEEGISQKQFLAWLEKQGKQNFYTSETMNEKEDFDNSFTRMMEKEQKPWSEKDENMIEDTIQFIEKGWTDNGKSHLIPWLKSLKGKLQPQPKQEWSKLDNRIEDCIGMCLTDISEKRFDDFKTSLKECLDWLHSLKDRIWYQPTQEWSEEDERKIDRIYSILRQTADTHAFSTSCRLIGDKECIELQDFLKSLRPQNKWKPSTLQIEALESATENCAYSEYQDCLRELAKQLKKL
jgi:hypothetical protein